MLSINVLYQDTKARVVTPDGETDFFNIKKGVLRGDTLAPNIFAIVIDYIMRQTYMGREEELGFTLERRRSRRTPPVTVTDLDFADDLAIITEEIDQAQEILNRLESEAGNVGLSCNAKTKVLQVFNHDSPVEVSIKNGTTLNPI